MTAEYSPRRPPAEHALVMFKEAPGEGPGLVVPIPVKSYCQLHPLRNWQAERMHLT